MPFALSGTRKAGAGSIARSRVHFDEVKDLFNTFLRHAARQHEKRATAEAA